MDHDQPLLLNFNADERDVCRDALEDRGFHVIVAFDPSPRIRSRMLAISMRSSRAFDTSRAEDGRSGLSSQSTSDAACCTRAPSSDDDGHTRVVRSLITAEFLPHWRNRSIIKYTPHFKPF